MGTRSLTFVHDGDAAKPLTCMYRQYDGYPSGHGLELQQFLAPFKVVNGIGPTTDDQSGIKVKCFAVGKRKNLLFEGSVEAFGEFCNRKEGY